LKGLAKQKVPGGKLLTVKLDYSDVIERIEVLGDFFLHPEDSLKEIEKSLIGVNVDESEQVLAEKVKRVVEMNNIELIGITPEAIAQTIKMAVKR
jgi:lipoate-protein ligase A